MNKRMSWILSVVAISLFLVVCDVQAYSSADLARLKKTNQCAGCNLARANLSGAKLISANLSGADLSGADLTNANLRKANLREANLNGANLKGTNFSEAIWTNGRTCKEGSLETCEY